MTLLQNEYIRVSPLDPTYTLVHPGFTLKDEIYGLARASSHLLDWDSSLLGRFDTAGKYSDRGWGDNGFVWILDFCRLRPRRSFNLITSILRPKITLRPAVCSMKESHWRHLSDWWPAYKLYFVFFFVDLNL
jgi:hypothetical protein